MITRRKAPYADTSVPAEHTRMEIDKLLRSYGIIDFQWTELWSKGIIRLRFPIELEPGRYVQVQVTPPPFTARRKTWNPKTGRHDIIEAPNWAQSMRCLLHWLKAKLESVAFGLKSVEEEFLSDLIVKGRNGQETTVSQLVLPALADGRLESLALEGPPPDRSNATDATARRLP